MATSSYSGNANVQSALRKGVRGRARAGEQPRHIAYHSDPVHPACVDPALNVSQISTVTFTASNAGEAMQLKIDGVVVPFTSTGANSTNATALEAALAEQLDEGDLLATILASGEANAAIVTLSFSDYETHTIELVAPGVTAATIATSTAASAMVQHKAGTFVARHATQTDPTLVRVKTPTSVSDRLIGLVEASPYPSEQTPLSNNYGLTEAGSWPTKTPFPVHDKGEWCVQIAGNVTIGDPIYVKTTGAKKGYAVATDGSVAGTSQVSELTVTPSATDTVGFHFDSLPALTVTSVDLATDNAALRDLFNGNAQYAAIGSAAVDAGKIVVTFSDDQAHTFTDDSSGGTADVASADTTDAVAAIAATAIKFKGQFTETRTLAQGDAYVDFDAMTPA